MKIQKIKFPVLKTSILFCITPDLEEAKKWFKKQRINIANWPHEAEAHTWTKSGFWPVVYLPGLKKAKEIANMCHEITHAIWFMFEEMDIKISQDNHEILTYHQTYIIKELLK